MTKNGAGLPGQRWSVRDGLAAAGLFLATAGVIFWQNAHVGVLWDVSYVLDSAARMAAGQMPYRDFPFVHAPLTFLIQAAILRFTGRVYLHHVVYMAVVGGAGTVLAWRIVLHTLRGRLDSAWVVALLLAAPLTVLGIYCIFPFPSYDCDCAFSILVAIWMLQRVGRKAGAGPASGDTRDLLRGFAAGGTLCLPLFFKQNIGLPFLAAGLAAILFLLGAEWVRRPQALPDETEAGSSLSEEHDGHTSGAKAQINKADLSVGVKTPTCHSRVAAPILLAVLAGAGATMLAALLLIHSTAGLGNYVRWTLQFAAQRRLPGLDDMLAVYLDPNLLWTLPCVAAGLLLLRRGLEKARRAAIALLAAPFLFTLCSLLLYDDADERGDSLLALWPLLLLLSAALALWNLRWFRRHASLGPLLPILLLVAINGTLMSQQLWGSTYAIWPLLVVLLGEMIAFLAGMPAAGLVREAKPKAPPVSSLFAVRSVAAFLLAAVVSGTLLVCGGFYTASEERLTYAQLPDEPARHATVPELAGMSAAGPYLPDFEELLRYAADRIPASDGLILLPGEDPFYFATGRVPRFPVLLFDPSTDPYSPAQVVEEARLHQIRWLIVKRELQIKEDPTPQREATLNLLLGGFKLVARLRGYDVYRRFVD